jgi:hypothetical protein
MLLSDDLSDRAMSLGLQFRNLPRARMLVFVFITLVLLIVIISTWPFCHGLTIIEIKTDQDPEPEDKCDRLLRNVGSHLQDCTVSQPEDHNRDPGK